MSIYSTTCSAGLSSTRLLLWSRLLHGITRSSIRRCSAEGHQPHLTLRQSNGWHSCISTLSVSSASPSSGLGPVAVVHRCFHSNAPVASSASKPKITRIAPLPETTNDPVAPVPPSMHCWKCNYYEPPDPPKDIPNAATPQFFCKNVKCAVLQPMQRPPPNHFALLFPERFPRLDDTLAQSGFEIDLIELKQRFRGLQQMLHPDNFSTKSLEERTLSEEQSTLVNKAYQVLRDPLFRAQYLLQIHGIVFEESISTDNSGFLLEIMEIQEEVEDAENDTSKLATLLEQNQARMATVEKQIASYFNKRDLEGAKLSVIQMQYLRTIDTLIKEKE